MRNTRSKRHQSPARTGPVTFTLRDLNRQITKVIEVCDAVGVVHIRTRDGRSYRLLPNETPPAPPVPSEPVLPFSERRQEYYARLRAAGFVPPNADEEDRLNRIISGEE